MDKRGPPDLYMITKVLTIVLVGIIITTFDDLFVIRLNIVALKVSLRQRMHNKQCLFISLRANLWRQ